MFRFSSILRGLLLIAAAALAVAALSGCGSSVSTAPQTLALSDDPVGEVPVPLRNAKIPRPINFQAEAMGGNLVRLTWDQPGRAYQAMITLDGQLLASVAASDGNYLESVGKAAGDHVYTICFCDGQRMGAASTAFLTIVGDPGTGDDDRTDKRPEDGR